MSPLPRLGEVLSYTARNTFLLLSVYPIVRTVVPWVAADIKLAKRYIRPEPVAARPRILSRLAAVETKILSLEIAEIDLRTKVAAADANMRRLRRGIRLLQEANRNIDRRVQWDQHECARHSRIRFLRLDDMASEIREFKDHVAREIAQLRPSMEMPVVRVSSTRGSIHSVQDVHGSEIS